MERMNLWGRIKARHLQSNVYTLFAFFLLFVVTTGLYVFIPDGLPGEFFIAVSTSLLASLFIGFFDIYNAYKNFENSEFIDNLYSFGIHNLHFDKKQVLERLIGNAHREIWISGYRLILTKELAVPLYEARRRGVDIRILVCPAWTQTYQLTYDDDESSVENYLALLRVLCHKDADCSMGKLEMRFVEKPLFNDTYIIDDKVVTSPYMHNRDLEFGVISARDFFTYEIDRGFKLFDLLRDEYELVWNSSNWKLYQDDIRQIVETLKTQQDAMKHLDYWSKVKFFTDGLNKNMDVDAQPQNQTEAQQTILVKSGRE